MPKKRTKKKPVKKKLYLGPRPQDQLPAWMRGLHIVCVGAFDNGSELLSGTIPPKRK